MTNPLPKARLPRPASPGFYCTIENRDLVVLNYRTRQTLTLRRAPGQSTLNDELHEVPADCATPAHFDQVSTLQQFRSWLTEHHAKPLSLPDSHTPIPFPVVQGDEWLPSAIEAVERSITTVVSEFVSSPYMHRVEHSLHARLFQVLKAQAILQGVVSIHTKRDSFQTQLVHKEWPETTARSDNRRGAFDLAVLSPNQFKDEVSVEHFRHGWIDAPIVIELGLDYDWWHLAQDCLKLINSGTAAAYVVHLTRGRISPKDRIPDCDRDKAETWVNQPGGRTKAAYARFDPDHGCVARRKGLSDHKVIGGVGVPS